MKRILALASAVLVAAGVAAYVTWDASADGREIAWKTCGQKPGAECGSLDVPRDYADPNAGTVKLNITRRAATDPDKRVGVLFFNPGGPGQPAAGYVRDAVDQTFSKDLQSRFDIIGIDSRGVGGSQQLSCSKPDHDPNVSLFPQSQKEFDQLVAHNKNMGDSCDDLISNMDTISVAKDFDQVRAALGESKINYLGLSYGTILGTAYAERFPHRVRTMSLDGVVDHGMRTSKLILDGSTALNKSFEAYAKWCDGSDKCALHGKDFAATFDALVKSTRDKPIPVPNERPITAEELEFIVNAGLDSVPEFAEPLSDALKQAVDGDGTKLAAIRTEAENPATSAPYRATLCQDIDPQLTNFEQLRHLANQAVKRDPHLGGMSEWWSIAAGCIGWPAAPKNPQHAVHIDDAPPILLVGNTGDPVTPVSGAESLSHGIEGSEVLTYDGVG
ncbi:MAG TPA: alpha/beta fold hydrolase, partial [Stackebrandtia sp.]|uniref:alpha/beta fold hydrolase n=1 Tax=Stackebrandtia sp. TaxID=2023065 RepID=UPI002D4563EB